MARLSEAPTAPASLPTPNTTTATEPPSIETLEAGKHINNIGANMRTKSRVLHQEPPANFEEVKRNLIRQNRNLARANSTQSLQIRTLGAEVSRLLSVNLGLKEELISLRKQLQTTRRNGGASDTGGFRRAMAAHLREMTVMLSSLQEESCITQSPQHSPETRKSMCLESMEFRERPSLKALMASSRMPTIRENKPYARPAQYGLELSPNPPADDIEPVESPKLTPPVARSDEVAEEKTEEEAYKDNIVALDAAIADELPTRDNTNIETRRRRKLSSSGALARRSSSFVLPLNDKEAPSTIFKTGAKRKLSERDNNVYDAAREISRQSPKKALSIFEEHDTSVDARTSKHNTARTVLGEKSINFSPQKSRRVNDAHKKTKEKASVVTAAKTDLTQAMGAAKTPRARSRPVAPTNMTVQHLLVPEIAEADLVLPPVTPFPADVLSPMSSEKSLMDTPPPMELSMRSSTSSNDVARPSRRARAAVNYAEPSLVAKMRRPSKAMVDALTGLQDPRRAMSTSGDVRPLSTDAEVETWQTGVTKQRHAEQKSAGDDDDDAAVEEMLEAKPIAEPRADLMENYPVQPTKTPSISLSTMMAAGRGRQSLPVASEASDLAIYDFDDTNGGSSPASTPAVAESKEAQKTSRRHSTAAKALSTTTEDRKVAATTSSGRSSSASMAKRRRSMMV